MINTAGMTFQTRKDAAITEMKEWSANALASVLLAIDTDAVTRQAAYTLLSIGGAR